ncbi:MAG: 3-dehydroquinate synthase [Treponema sp.]|jgi:3-dehydroquinate synthase|nr:3-dehydroquinate synthase [Treponema sp.]
MNTPDYTIQYRNSDLGQTGLFFYNSAPDLAALYPSESVAATGRFFVTDTAVAALPCMKDFISRFTLSGDTGCRNKDLLLVITAGETYKTIDTVLRIAKTALEHNLGRKSLFVAIGGGVVSDLTAFAASIFKRGAGLEIVPTTLLAMADAAVGGKTGCDFGAYKNMLGTFYPARRIHFYPAFLRTLPEGEYRSGLAEALKTGLLFNAGLFDLFKAGKKKLFENESAMIRACVMAKAKIVEEDVTEEGPRMLLNFGHTFAHALESVVGLGKVSHGDAVAWGMGRALDLSVRLGLCAPAYRDEVYAVLAAYGWETGPVHPALAAQITDMPAVLIEAMKKDKKNSSEKIRVILQKGLSDTVIQEVAEDRIRVVLAGG